MAASVHVATRAHTHQQRHINHKTGKSVSLPNSFLVRQMRQNFHVLDAETADEIVCSSFLPFGVWLIFSNAQESLGNEIFFSFYGYYWYLLASETWRLFSLYFGEWTGKLGVRSRKQMRQVSAMARGSPTCSTPCGTLMPQWSGSIMLVSNSMFLFMDSEWFYIILIFLTW